MIKLDITTKEKYLFDFNILYLTKKLIKEVLNCEKIDKDISVNLTLVSKNTIRKINKENRGIDKVTDVLSFPNIDFKKPSDFKRIKKDISVIDLNTNTYFLGDIVICYDIVLKQAKEYNHSIKREYSFLVVHSILHLLGYDHLKSSDEKKMFKKQNDILNNLSITE